MSEESSDYPLLHWVALAGCCLVMLGLGVLAVTRGATPDSRFFAIDTIVVRIIGAAMLLFAFALPLRRDWAFIGAIVVFGISIVESLVTYNAGAASLDEILFFLAVVAALYGLPLLVLLWLRRALAVKGR